MSDAIFTQSEKIVMNCIKEHLNLDVSDITVLYVNNLKFYNFSPNFMQKRL